MGFFQKIKNKLGIGGVSVSLQVPNHVSKDEGVISGKVVLNTKSEQELVKLDVKLIEVYTTGRGDDKKSKEFELGVFNKNLNGAMIKPGETVEYEFSFPFMLQKSSNQDLSEKGGALGAIGKLGSYANNEKSEFFVEAEVDVKSASLDPSDKKDIKIS